MQDFRPRIPFDNPGTLDYCRPDVAPTRPLLVRSAVSLLCGGGALCLFTAMWAHPSDEIVLLCLLSPLQLLVGLICGISGVRVADASERVFALISLAFSVAGIVGAFCWFGWLFSRLPFCCH